MLQLIDLTVTYGDRIALAPVCVAIPAGRLVAVTGASGAGKSSLLRAIAGLVADSGSVTGSVLLDGAPLGTEEVGVVPQGNHLARVLTALENIALPLSARAVAERSARSGRSTLAAGGDPLATARSALHSVGLGESGNHLVEELSGGQQQRVAVARALARVAPVVLADECTSDLDGTNREIVLAALRAEARRGSHVLFATNDLDAAEECDAHAALDDGQLSWVRPPG